MIREYTTILTHPQSKLFRLFLKSLGVDYEASECGQNFYFTIRLKESLVDTTRSFLDKI